MYCVRSGIVYLSVSLYATNGKTVTGPPVEFMPKTDIYVASFYYNSNNVMGVWVPGKGDNSRTIYLYDLSGSAGHRLSTMVSWPLED